MRLGLHALAVTDHDGFYAAPMLAEAAAAYDLPTVFGAELSLGLTAPQNGVPDPEGSHLLVLARGVEGYHRLAAAMTDAHLRGDEKGRPLYDLDELAERGRGHWAVLTGCRKGTVRQALARGGEPRPAEALDRLTALFGLEHVLVELSPRPGADAHQRGARPAGRRPRPRRRRGRQRPPRHARSSTGWPRRWRPCALAAAWPSSTAGSTCPARPTCAAAPRRPPRSRRTPTTRRGRSRAASRSPTSWPSTCTRRRPRCPSGRSPRATPPTRGCGCWPSGASPSATPASPTSSEARERLEHELRVIEEKDFAGYFVIVHDIVAFAREQRHPLPGPGIGGELGGLLRPRASPRSTPSSTGCRSSGSSPRTATRSPTSTSTSTPTGARRSSSGSTTPTAAATPPRSPTSSPTGRGWRCATPPRRSASPPASRTPGPSRSTAGSRWWPATRATRPPTTSRRRWSPSPTS